MRDKILPEAQSQLDEIAAQMSKAFSDVTTPGTAVTALPLAGFSSIPRVCSRATQCR